MLFDYLSKFPIPQSAIPQKLRELLQPVGLSTSQLVEVAAMQEKNLYGPEEEILHLLMAVVPNLDAATGPIEVLSEAKNGVVEYSTPFEDTPGNLSSFSPSISGYDYIVGAWGDGSFYTFNLAEKVWMSLGLTARCIGNDKQRIIYDDLGLPQFGIADGEISTSYDGNLKRQVCWKMSNEYLRRYLRLRNSRGVRVFYYSKQLDSNPEMEQIMSGKDQIRLTPNEGVIWYNLDIRKNNGGFWLQIWASVEAVMPKLCPKKSANSLVWPGYSDPMTYDKANALTGANMVYLNDCFLQKYEQNSQYNSTPINIYGQWRCSPSYGHQWGFSECCRVGRNLIQVPMRELYKPKPDIEILHAQSFAVNPSELNPDDFEGEHIVAKTQRLLDAFLQLGEALERLGKIVNKEKTVIELTGFDHSELEANGWEAYPKLCRLAQVAPLGMTQQNFLERCKSLHEILQRIPNGYLKMLLTSAGCPKNSVKELGSFKLLQALLNIIENLNINGEAKEAFISNKEPEGWKENNENMASLFLNNDLRVANAHESIQKHLITLQTLGFDIAYLNEGYGRAFDFVMDKVIDALSVLTNKIKIFLDRE